MIKKLSLSKESLANLTPAQTEQVQGGATAFTDPCKSLFCPSLFKTCPITNLTRANA